MSFLLSTSFLVALLGVANAGNTVFLSAFGNDNNDGLSAGTAVATLARAYSIASPMQAPTIQLAPGVISLGRMSVTLTSLALVGSGSSGNSDQFKLSCASASDALLISSGTLSIVGISFDNCQNPLQLTGYSGSRTLLLDNVWFNNNNVEIGIYDGTNTVVATRTRFNPVQRSVGLFRNQPYTAAFYGTFIDSSFSAGSGNVLDTAVTGSYSSAYSGSWNITGCTFQSQKPTTFLASDAFLVTLTQSSFRGAVNSPGCAVRLSNGKSQISNVQFDSHSGSPALCLINSPSSVLSTSFTSNQGNSSVTGNQLPGAALYISGATVAVGNSVFRSNTVTGDGAGIHCELSRLTVANSDFSSNHATNAAACSSYGCTVVSYGNMVGRNQEGSSSGSCALMK